MSARSTPTYLRFRESCGLSRTPNRACGLRAIQQSEHFVKAAPEDECGVGINADLDPVLRALNDWRVRHQPGCSSGGCALVRDLGVLTGPAFGPASAQALSTGKRAS